MTRRARHDHLPDDADQVRDLISRATFFSDWAEHLDQCNRCEAAFRAVLGDEAVATFESSRAAELVQVPEPPSRERLLRWGLLSFLVLFAVWGLWPSMQNREAELLLLSRAPDASTADTESLEVRLLVSGASSPTRKVVWIDRATGLARLRLGRSDRGVALVRSLDGNVLAGVGRVEAGSSLLILGPPGSEAHSDHATVSLLESDSPVGRRLIAALPFVHEDAAAQTSIATSRLATGVSVVMIDDLALFNGDSLLWSETFETTRVGELPAQWSTIYPPDHSSRRDGVPQGYVVDARAFGGGRALISTSLPERSRIDGRRVTPKEITTGRIRYTARILLPSKGDRGAVIGLKKETAEVGKWYDRASLRFARGEIRFDETLIGTYRPGHWSTVEVVFDMAAQLVTATIDGSTCAPIPQDGLWGIRNEQPSWDESTARGFEWFGFGGVFYSDSIPSGTGPPLPSTIDDSLRHHFNLDGDIPGWRPTGIRLAAGDSLRIEAAGEVYYAGRGPARTSADGYRLELNPPIRTLADPHDSLQPSAWLGALLYKIGDEPGQFAGARTDVVVARAGELFLGYNDSHYGDNSGYFTVTVTVSASH